MFRRSIAFAAAGLAALLIAAFAAPPASAKQSPRSSGDLAPATASDAAETSNPTSGVDIVFCIDVSGSMAFQMARMKEAVRAVVREAVEAYPGGTPIRLGLVRYGNADRNYFVQHPVGDHARFFRNLDATKAENCGMEYFGAVVKVASERLKWSDDPAVEKFLFVVGNETAAQGPNHSSYRLVIPKAVAKGIRVSALYCPAPRDVVSARPGEARYSDAYRDKTATRRVLSQELTHKTTWVDAAGLGQGRFLQLSWGTESPLLSWEPEAFRQALAQVNSAEFEATLAYERNAVSYEEWLNRQLAEAYRKRLSGGSGRPTSGFFGGRSMASGVGGGAVRR